jgi:hypothetical protein
MTFEYTSDGANIKGSDWIAAEGTISANTPDQFRQFLAGNATLNTTVKFNSPGGNLIAALKLGELIRQAHLGTSIRRTVFNKDGGPWSDTQEGICVSACAYAFLGGEERSASKGYGVHQFYDAKALDEPEKKAFSAIDVSIDQVLVGMVLDYVQRMGVDAKLISLAEATPPWEMHYLTDADLRRFRIDNFNFIDSGWRIEASGGGAALEIESTYSIRPPVAVTLLCRSAKPGLNLLIASSTEYLDRWLMQGYGLPHGPNAREVRAAISDLSVSGPGWERHLTTGAIGSLEIDPGRRITISIDLSPEVVGRLRAGGPIKFGFGFPLEYSGFLYTEIASSVPREALGLILRNCVR